jgi:RNA polymerase sigma-70 factor (ECF subfamily)
LIGLGASAADETSDLELLEAWRAGDRERGSALFRRYARSVSRFFRTKLPESAEDLTQSTFLALLEGERGFRGDATFRAYVFGIARNQLLMHFRTRGRFRDRFDPLTRSAVDAGASPARIVARHDQQRIVLAALQRLPVDYQVALELHYFEGLRLEEIAEVLGHPVGTIKSHLSRGRVLLGEHLREVATSEELLASTATGLEQWFASLPEIVDAQGTAET